MTLLGLADNFTDLIRVMRERRIQLGISQLAPMLGAVAGGRR